MTIFKNSQMDILHYDEGSYEGLPCQVRLSNGEIVIDYLEDNTRVIYRGIDDGSGHYQLDSPEINGRATLHRFPNSEILEGSWIEGGYRGMWKIHLAE